MPLDESIISYAVKYPDGMTKLQRAGVSRDHFVDEYKSVWAYLLRMRKDHDSLPSADTLCARFPDLSLPRVQKRELPILLTDLRQRYKFIRLLHAVNKVADDAVSYDVVDEVINALQGDLNTIAFSRHDAHLVDLFSQSAQTRMLKDQRARRRGVVGIPTGLKSFDEICGGLVPQKMVVTMARTGKGKSWINALFIVSAVMSGKKVIFYPLEMTFEETAHRLYTIFSSKLLGPSQALKNHDLSRGRINLRQLREFLKLLSETIPGQLLIADVGSLGDPYTVERIEAEVELNSPDMAWVDYVTLMKHHGNEQGYQLVQELSHGLAGIAKRRKVVMGCSAQVNREALRDDRIFLPRVEHIAYGDSIGQDADQVFSLNRSGRKLHYALVKNRGGPEISKRDCTFDVNVGLIEESSVQDEEDSD